MTDPSITIRVVPGTKGPGGKLADVELYFTAGLLAGLKLIGFGVWRARGEDGRLIVTLPARQYRINGEHKTLAFLRPIEAPAAREAIRDAIVAAYTASQFGEEDAPRS